MTNADIQAGLEIMIAAVEAIRDAKSIPSGTLYAAMMDTLSHDAYESMIRQVLRTGLVKQENHLLTWIGE
jgi:hypothetical protein